MPIYEYRCSACGHELEALQKLSEPPLVDCPACHADALVKKVSAAGFQLKGSGWYATDFRNGSKPAAKAKTDDKPANGDATAAGDGAKSKARRKPMAQPGPTAPRRPTAPPSPRRPPSPPSPRQGRSRARQAADAPSGSRRPDARRR